MKRVFVLTDPGGKTIYAYNAWGSEDLGPTEMVGDAAQRGWLPADRYVALWPAANARGYVILGLVYDETSSFVRVTGYALRER